MLARIARKVLLTIVSGTTTVILAACYGMSEAVDGDDYRIPIDITTVNAAKSPIDGLEVVMSCTVPEQEFTEETLGGLVQFRLEEDTDLTTCAATITDKDGIDNLGLFQTETVQLNAEDSTYEVEMTEQ